MNRSIVNFFVDLSSLLVAGVMAVTGLILAFVLPPGTGGLGRGQGLALWGWPRHDWGDLHCHVATAFLVLLILHLALHWRWIWTMSSRAIHRRSGISDRARSRPRRLGGAILCGGVAALLVGFACLAWPRAAPAESGRYDRPRSHPGLAVASTVEALQPLGGRPHWGGTRLGWGISGTDRFEQIGQGGRVEMLGAGQ
jgi:hypothetical protein